MQSSDMEVDRPENVPRHRGPLDRRSQEEQSNVYKLVIIIYHAEKCKKSDAPCTAPEYCETGRQMLEHAEDCNAGMSCPEPNCLLSKKLVSHINACPSENCIFCQMVPPNIKEWYFSVTIRFRYTNILGMVRVISDMYPEFNEQRISRLNVFAKKTENRAFMTANSKDEYHRFLAVKLHEIVRSLHQCAPAA